MLNYKYSVTWYIKMLLKTDTYKSIIDVYIIFLTVLSHLRDLVFKKILTWMKVVVCPRRYSILFLLNLTMSGKKKGKLYCFFDSFIFKKHLTAFSYIIYGM